jgi:restriction system protein
MADSGAAPIDLMWPTVVALRDLGGSAALTDISGEVDSHDGPGRAVEYRLVWACNYLRNIGVVQDGGDGVWSLTERGWAVTPEEMLTLPPRPTCGA